MDTQDLQTQLTQVEKLIADLEAGRGVLSEKQRQEALAPFVQRKAELEAQLSAITHIDTGGGDAIGRDKTVYGDDVQGDKVGGDKVQGNKISVTGSGAVAVGDGAVAVGERGVNVGGNVSGSIITGDNSKVGGIQAHTIKAENVVSGVQMLGGEASDAAALVDLAKAIGSGSIKADSIEAKNVVAGLQYIADPAQATPDQLRQELAALQKQLAEIIESGEIDDATDVEDVQADLAVAEAELANPDPKGNRVVHRLKSATEVLSVSAGTVDAASKAGIALIKLAPVAATLYQIATKMFGG